ncbi:MYG1 exonuclease-like isoform X1 [Temnothorax longispinosus]|uniref:MYG1 exonuclease-like isoform X1 n=1 Tax=Temnothorax longispinosus TaxID=300112 RepID=UPI003A9A3CAA
MSVKSIVRIGIHDGDFYCSEVLACALLKLLPQFKDASIVRSGDKSVLDTCDIVVDVGGEYDPSRHRYDHNIKDFKESVNTIIRKPGYDSTVELTSAGLIYCHFGHKILRNVLSDVTEGRVIDEMFKFIYNKLIKEIDAIDNNEQMYLSCTDLSARIHRLNFSLNSQEKEKQFEKAVALARKEFLEIVQDVKNVHLPSMDIVRHAVESRFEVDPSGEIITLSKFLLYEEYLFKLEKEINISPSIKYVILKNQESRDCFYWIECMPVALRSRMYRMLLPQAWGGLKSDALVKACGIEGALFVLPRRCMGSHKTKDGAISMAQEALKIGKTVQSGEK